MTSSWVPLAGPRSSTPSASSPFAFAFASGHYHLLLQVDDTRQLSAFMQPRPRSRAYGEFLGAFRTAAEKLRAGARDVVFPAGSFPPALPWVSG